MKEVRTRNIYFFIGLLLLSLGGSVLAGWLIHSKSLITLFTNGAPLGFICLWSLIFSGLLFILKSFPKTIIIARVKLILATLVIVNSFLMAWFCLTGFSPYLYLFPNGEFTSYFLTDHNIYPHLAWALAGFLMCHTTYKPDAKYLSYLETINFILLFFGIQGIVQSLHKFELVYTWLNNFSMPLPYAIGLTIVNIGMIIAWGDIHSTSHLNSDEEDRQIRFFSTSMLTQAIISSVFFGAMMLASQNELFLKTSLEKYFELKSLVLNETINNEILEVQRAVKSIDIKLDQKKTHELNEHNIPDLTLLLTSQDFSAAQITDIKGAKLFSQGKFIFDNRDTVTIPSLYTTKLIRSDGWLLYFKAPIQINTKTVGYIEFQKPIKGLSEIINADNKFSPSEIKVICAQTPDGSPHCLSSKLNEDIEWIANSFNPFTIKSPIGQAFIDQSKYSRKNISVVENLKDVKLRFAILIDADEIEKNLRHQLYIAIPIIFLFILFFMRMLNWHIIPIFRRSANAEKDAIDSARMVSDSESKIRTIVDSIGECVIVFSEDGKIDSMNQTALTTFGLAEVSIKNISFTVLLNINASDFQKYLYTNYGQWREATGHRLDRSTFDAQIKFKDVKTRQRSLFIAIIRDVTEQKSFETKLAQSEKVFRNSFDHAPIGMMVLNMKNKIMQVNQSLCAMLGYHESELLGNNIKLVLPDYLRTENSLPFQKLAEIGIKNYTIESPMLTKSGGLIQTVSSMTLFLSQREEECFFVAQIQDETMRQRYEAELRQANEELQDKFKELKNHTRVTEELNNMNGILQACLTISEALPPIEKFAEKLFEDIQGAVYLNTPDAGHMELAVRWGEANDNVDLIKNEDCWALRRSQPYIADNTHEQITCYHYENSIIEGQICIPLTAQGELIGLMTLYSIDENFEKQSKDLTRLAMSFADHIALSLSNIRLRERLQHQSIIDALTSLYNRRYFDETMKIELSRAERKDQSLSLLIVDIDHFKKFNDTYGHDVGDIVLQEVSGVLKKNVRASDIACRMGGEEFAIVMPDASIEVAHERAEILRKAISKIAIKNGGKSIDPITASVGIATYPDHANTTKLLIESADMALYAAKNQGRNRCISATALTSLGSLKGKTKPHYKAKET